MSSPPSIAVGSVVGGFRIEEKIGEGGMAVVYRATQEDLGRPVALKIIKPDLLADATFRARFERESRVTSAVDHPNVIPIYAAGDENGIAFLAMRLVDGIDLRTLIEREGALEPPRAARIVAQAARALDAAHTVGLVHHDVKPGNILLGGDDHVYLTDFGLAKYGPARDPLTRPGQALGSLDYMAPEQIRGEAVDARADQYALGAVLYEALTGEPPYGDQKGMRVLWAHLQDQPPPPSAKVPNLPRALDQVVARALAKDPDERYPSAGDLGEAALAAAGGAPLPTPAPSPAPALGAAAPRPADGTPEPIATSVEPASRRPLRFQLKPGFSYVHQPLATEEHVIPLLGNEDVVDSLAERIAHSAGGSFLVTGFRGVGKTTVIARALERLDANGDGAPRVLPIFLNVARPRTTEELMFDVIRRLFETLVDAEILGRLGPEVQRQLILAYTRTSMSFKETRDNTVERARGVGVGAAAPLVEALSAKLDFSKKTSDSLATEASFLAYSDADVEHDFVRILSLFRRGQEPDDHARRGWRRQMLGGASLKGSAPAWDGKVVVVIDELDKLTAREDGMRCIEELLNGLKNLLTTRGVHFLFVAGPDLHDVALRESNRGNSVYESVFGWHLYVPCVWSGTGRLLDAVVADVPERQQHYLNSLRDYLEFKARGVPRLLLMEFNSFVEWDGDEAFLTLRPWDLARLEFYAELERTLERFLHQDTRAPVFSVAIDDDRWRVGAYYVTDWILRNRSTFTVDDVVGSDRGLTIDPLLVLSASKVERLLEHLVEHEVLERVRGNAADETYFGDVPEAQRPVYRLAEDTVAKLDSFMRINERERAQLVPEREGSLSEPAPAQPWADTDPDVAVVMNRYVLHKEIDRGGLGRVYRAYDRSTGQEVAVKLLESSAIYGDERVRARFLRKGELAKSVSHPNIAATHDVFSEDDGRLGIVMEFIDGTSLGHVLGRTPMSAADAVAITRQLLDAVEYLDGCGVVRLDLKPSSILLDHDLRPVIVDLGLAKSTGEGAARYATMAEGVVVGTPAYAAPEQLAGEPVDIRGDLYSVGLLLFEMLAGRPAREGDEPMRIIFNAVTEDVDLTGLEVSPELHDVLARALSREPDGRYSSPREMRAALDSAPEAGPSEPRVHAA
jgi:serine/threonine protein kinase